jgi:hypothetical protein
MYLHQTHITHLSLAEAFPPRQTISSGRIHHCVHVNQYHMGKIIPSLTPFQPYNEEPYPFRQWFLELWIRMWHPLYRYQTVGIPLHQSRSLKNWVKRERKAQSVLLFVINWIWCIHVWLWLPRTWMIYSSSSKTMDRKGPRSVPRAGVSERTSAPPLTETYVVYKGVDKFNGGKKGRSSVQTEKSTKWINSLEDWRDCLQPGQWFPQCAKWLDQLSVAGHWTRIRAMLQWRMSGYDGIG